MQIKKPNRKRAIEGVTDPEALRKNVKISSMHQN
jgi:hypothetical protein